MHTSDNCKVKMIQFNGQPKSEIEFFSSQEVTINQFTGTNYIEAKGVIILVYKNTLKYLKSSRIKILFETHKIML